VGRPRRRRTGSQDARPGPDTGPGGGNARGRARVVRRRRRNPQRHARRLPERRARWRLRRRGRRGPRRLVGRRRLPRPFRRGSRRGTEHAADRRRQLARLLSRGRHPGCSPGNCDTPRGTGTPYRRRRLRGRREDLQVGRRRRPVGLCGSRTAPGGGRDCGRVPCGCQGVCSLVQLRRADGAVPPGRTGLWADTDQVATPAPDHGATTVARHTPLAPHQYHVQAGTVGLSTD